MPRLRGLAVCVGVLAHMLSATGIITTIDVLPADHVVTEYTHYGLILTQNPSSTVVIVSCVPECDTVTVTYNPATMTETARETLSDRQETTIITAGCAYQTTSVGTVTRVASCSEGVWTQTAGSSGGWAVSRSFVWANYLMVPVTASYYNKPAYGAGPASSAS